MNISMGLALSVIFPSLIGGQFTATPGLLRNDEGESVSLLWDIPFDDTATTYFFVYRDGVAVVYYQGGGACTPYTPHGTCVATPTQVGLSLWNIQSVDAGQYEVEGQFFAGGSPESNTNAALYIYLAPSVPVVTGNSLQPPGVQLNLSCDSNSQSQPEALRAGAVILYEWSGARTSTGPDLSFTATETDDGSTITCTTREDGANLTVTSSTTVTLRIGYYELTTTVDGATNTTEGGDTNSSCVDKLACIIPAVVVPVVVAAVATIVVLLLKKSVSRTHPGTDDDHNTGNHSSDSERGISPTQPETDDGH